MHTLSPRSFNKQVVKMGGRELLWHQAPPATHAALLRGAIGEKL